MNKDKTCYISSRKTTGKPFKATDILVLLLRPNNNRLAHKNLGFFCNHQPSEVYVYLRDLVYDLLFYALMNVRRNFIKIYDINLDV